MNTVLGVAVNEGHGGWGVPGASGLMSLAGVAATAPISARTLYVAWSITGSTSNAKAHSIVPVANTSAPLGARYSAALTSGASPGGGVEARARPASWMKESSGLATLVSVT